MLGPDCKRCVVLRRGVRILNFLVALPCCAMTRWIDQQTYGQHDVWSQNHDITEGEFHLGKRVPATRAMDWIDLLVSSLIQ